MKMTFQPKKRSRSKVHGFRARMSSAGREERFLLPEEQKEENSFQHRPQQCGLFFYRLSSYYIRRRDGAICFIEKER